MDGCQLKAFVLFQLKMFLTLVMYYIDIYFRHISQILPWRDEIQLVTPGEVLELANSSQGNDIYYRVNEIDTLRAFRSTHGTKLDSKSYL